MGKEKVISFVNRNIVTIVMVPVLLGIHWGWTKIQEVEVLVSKEEKKDLPIILIVFKQYNCIILSRLVSGTRYLEKKLEDKITSWKSGEEVIPEK